VDVARAYSDDLREKVLGAYASGKGTFRELAERFDVSYGWVAKIHAAELGTGSRRRVPQRRRPSGIDGEQVRRLVRQKPDIVLRELQQAMLESGRGASLAQLWRVLKQLGLVLKKSRSMPPSATSKPTSRSAQSSSRSSAGSRSKT
jgi:transposase